MKRIRYPYRFKLKHFGKENQKSCQLFLTQNRLFKEKIASYSENVFMGKRKTLVSYDKKRFIFWLKKGPRHGRYPYSQRIYDLVLLGADCAAEEDWLNMVQFICADKDLLDKTVNDFIDKNDKALYDKIVNDLLDKTDKALYDKIYKDLLDETVKDLWDEIDEDDKSLYDKIYEELLEQV